MFAPIEQITMKNFLLFLFIAAIATPAFSQTKNTVDSIGTTANGLPVLRSYVAPDVVFRAKKKYGRLLYCIEKTARADCENSYLVGLIKNGRLTIEWMCDDPKIALRSDKRDIGNVKLAAEGVCIATKPTRPV